MKVTLLHSTPLWVCARAIRTCWNSHDKSDTSNGICGEKDRELIERVGNKNKHSSTLEHISFTFEIKGISRACLQELARHRMASLSVKSTRYTLKELKVENNISNLFNHTAYRHNGENIETIRKYLVLLGDNIQDAFPNIDSDEEFTKCERISYDCDNASISALIRLRNLLQLGYSNDVIKSALPESYKTNLVWTINARSLQNFLGLRTSKSAHWEIRKLAYSIFKALPKDVKYLFEDFINKEAK